MELSKEQQKAFGELIKVFKSSGHRTPIFLYGQNGVGKTAISKKLTEKFGNELSLISIKKAVINCLKEFPEKNIQEEFLLQHNSEDFLNEIISRNLGKKILILDDIDYLFSNPSLTRLKLRKDYSFGKNSDFIMNGNLVWIFPLFLFKEFQKFWDLHDIPLKKSKFIEVSTPNFQSLKDTFDKYKEQEEFEISDKEIESCLNDKNYTTLESLIRKKRRFHN